MALFLMTVFRYFVFSPGVFSLFFAWRFSTFHLALFRITCSRAITPGENTKKNKNEITKWHKPATKHLSVGYEKNIFRTLGLVAMFVVPFLLDVSC